jgi:hypothetical protein
MDTHDQEFDLHGEEGSVTLVSLVVAFTLLLILALLVNSGYVVTRKIETQNAADAAATAASVELARGMNAITATNHLIGELAALVVLHHSFGGFELDMGIPKNFKEETQNDLQEAFQAAQEGVTQPVPGIFEMVIEDPSPSGAAIFNSRESLKELLTFAYEVRALGNLLIELVVTADVGEVLTTLATVFEIKIGQEWVELQVIEVIMLGLVPIKEAVWHLAIPALHQYTVKACEEAPQLAEQAAQAVAREHGMQVQLYPSADSTGGPVLRLPIHEEPLAVVPMKSQLVRATAPWVKWWRVPIVALGDATLTLSGFTSYYTQENDKNVFIICFLSKLAEGVNLYVLDDLDVTLYDKGYEPWVTDSKRADQLFSVMAFAYRPPTPVMGAPLFRQPNPDGYVAYAQAMIYNGNLQEQPVLWWQVAADAPEFWAETVADDPLTAAVCAGLWPYFMALRTEVGPLYEQPEVGWDTLNWGGPVPEQAYPDDPLVKNLFLNMGQRKVEPPINLNWQAKLVPTTRLDEAAAAQMQGPVGKVLQRLGVPAQPIARTH